MASSQDERNDEVADEESAPLLSTDETETAAPAQSRFERATYLLTSLAISSATLTIAFAVVTYILLAAQRYGYVPYEFTDAIPATVISAIVSILLGGVNLARVRRGRPWASLPVNLIVDGLIAFFAIFWAGQGLGGVFGYGYDSWDTLPAHITAGITMLFGMLFGLFHLALFALRCRKAFLTNAIEGPWSLPGGQLTLEISIKSFKEPQTARKTGEEEV